MFTYLKLVMAEKTDVYSAPNAQAQGGVSCHLKVIDRVESPLRDFDQDVSDRHTAGNVCLLCEGLRFKV